MTHEQIIDAAQSEAVKAESWADFSNFLFDQETGLLPRLFPILEDRQRFMASPTYAQLKEILHGVQDRTGFVAGMTPKKVDRLVVSVPANLHSTLVTEALREGVSLNQLVFAKLAAPLGQPIVEATVPLRGAGI